MAANPRDIIIRPIVTEKTSDMMKDNKYTFQVAMGANKTEIRQAIEAIFKCEGCECQYHPRSGQNQAYGQI